MRAFSVVAVSLLLALGCGTSPETGEPAAPTTAGSERPPLDWALLLPIETEGLFQIDLARMRRSPYRDSFEPVLNELVGEVTEAPMQNALHGLMERTNLVLIAMVPSEPEDEIVMLTRGRYRPDELAQLDAAAPEHHSRVVDVLGHQVWVGEDDNPTAMTQLRPNTLALTGSVDRLERLIARTRMAPATRRWPSGLRDVVEATNLEDSTFGLALAHRRIGGERGRPVEMTLAGTADADGPLDISVVVELGNPTLAAATTMFFEGLVRELSERGGGESFALGQLADLAHIEAVGSRVQGSVHAPPDTAAQLVPGLMGLLRDSLVEPEQTPNVISPMPTPL